MATVFSMDNVKMKDSNKAMSLFNQIINEQKYLAYKIYFIEKYLQEKEPQKYTGKDYLIKDYIQNMKKVDKEFRTFVEKLERWERKSYLLKKERNPADIKKEIETLMDNSNQNPVEVIQSILKNTFDNNLKNCRILETICQDSNFKNFERFLTKNSEIIKQHVKQNIISKNVSQPR